MKRLYLLACVAFPIAVLLLLHLHQMAASTGFGSVAFIGFMLLDGAVALFAAIKLIDASFFDAPSSSDGVGFDDINLADRFFYPFVGLWCALILGLSAHRAAGTTGFHSYYAMIWVVGAAVLLLPTLVLATKAIGARLRLSTVEPAQTAARKI